LPPLARELPGEGEPLYWRGPLGLAASLGGALAAETAGPFLDGAALRGENGAAVVLRYGSEEEARSAAAALGGKAEGDLVFTTVGRRR